MTVEELLDCVKDVNFETGYQQITTCPDDPVIAR